MHETPEVCPVCGTNKIHAIQRQSVIREGSSPKISGVVGYRCENGRVSIAPEDTPASGSEDLSIAA